ncbi:hypothetical protein GOHSU_30_00110 [Gordonia hirsuta DSM 44140 = NBRC 16056]|uniref:Coenzyme Q-binding protein COQ10 START domain-containing protein n=2 Tax=Gordonia hirsuta TaxID=53427 RepID=L7LDF0_9ACTN|nr:hypothetical protein GOHSU_30_00110 [Gordonia hirsuta DSM 44140 = NBRC 16056]
MLHEKHKVVVPAPLETTLRILQDVESMDGWIRPYLPRRPRVSATTTVLERTSSGAPRLVRLKTSAAGIGDTSLTEYVWTDTGCRTMLRASKVLRASNAAIDLLPIAAGTLLTLEATVELKIRLPKLVELSFHKYQQDFTSAVTRAFIAEGRRRSAGVHQR